MKVNNDKGQYQNKSKSVVPLSKKDVNTKNIIKKENSSVMSEKLNKNKKSTERNNKTSISNNENLSTKQSVSTKQNKMNFNSIQNNSKIINNSKLNGFKISNDNQKNTNNVNNTNFKINVNLKRVNKIREINTPNADKLSTNYNTSNQILPKIKIPNNQENSYNNENKNSNFVNRDNQNDQPKINNKTRLQSVKSFSSLMKKSIEGEEMKKINNALKIPEENFPSLMESIKVCIRIRPLNLKEPNEKNTKKSIKVQDNQTLTLIKE